MDIFQEAKNLINNSQNIYIFSSEEREESITSALALFYTLKDLNKNVNLTLEKVPSRLKFLIPSLDHITYPKNLSISIPKASAEISQIRYEKNEDNLKFYLTVDKGNIKKSDVSFCFTELKLDLIITVGLKDLGEIKNSNSFNNAVLSDLTILNIDNQKENLNFGRINLLKDNESLSELTFNFIKSISENLVKKEVATILLAGIIIASDNFKSDNTSPQLLEASASLIKKGGNHQEIISNLCKN
ncbi:hypothetical protein KJ786_00860 [Patescibacteria group bacterium]|nr:hypothetical protein [Patescibacteria group bacterium]